MLGGAAADGCECTSPSAWHLFLGLVSLHDDYFVLFAYEYRFDSRQDWFLSKCLSLSPSVAFAVGHFYRQFVIFISAIFEKAAKLVNSLYRICCIVRRGEVL